MSWINKILPDDQLTKLNIRRLKMLEKSIREKMTFLSKTHILGISDYPKDWYILNEYRNKIIKLIR